MAEQGRVAETIVVAHDGSPAAQSAASLAIQIARSQQLQIRGVYVEEAAAVLDPYPSYEGAWGNIEYPASHRELLNQAEERGQLVLLWLHSQCRAAHVEVTTSLALGSVTAIVLEEATTAAVLAMGRRGWEHGASAERLGRHFRAIAHQIRQPLLVGGESVRPIERVLVAYNQSDRAQLALSWAALLHRTLPAEVLVLMVQEDNGASQLRADMVRSRCAQRDLTQYALLHRSGPADAEIVAAAAEHHSDLIIMGSYSHGAWLEWLIGSTVEQVLCHTPLPLLLT